jgi:hypothetical protein
MRPDPRSDYWFPAKTYGWGWGWPRRWQGWVVMVLWLAMLLAGLLALHSSRHPVAIVIGVVVHVGLLLAICWWKGEPPRWRWGGE